MTCEHSNVSTRSATHGPEDTLHSNVGVRLVDIAACRPDGSIVTGQRKVPTLPVFDAAFSAFTHGTHLQAVNGVLAIEDLHPGDRLLTADGGSSEVAWIGAASFTSAEMSAGNPLTRVMADSFGMSRPDNILGLGPAARLLQTPPDLRNAFAATPIMTPARAFVDGVNVIEITPPTPVRMYHLCLQRHAAVFASGLEIETYHPGADPIPLMSQTLRSVFMSVFPQIKQMSDFGPLNYSRAPQEKGLTADEGATRPNY